MNKYAVTFIAVVVAKISTYRSNMERKSTDEI
jgi:hypothetical protein